MCYLDYNVLENVVDMIFYWVYYEKLIVIDYEMVFIGGLDLCFGRWDSYNYVFFDLYLEGVSNEVWFG